MKQQQRNLKSHYPVILLLESENETISFELSIYPSVPTYSEIISHFKSVVKGLTLSGAVLILKTLMLSFTTLFETMSYIL